MEGEDKPFYLGCSELGKLLAMDSGGRSQTRIGRVVKDTTQIQRGNLRKRLEGKKKKENTKQR